MKKAYQQLAVLLGAHFYADMTSGLLAGFLPVALNRFHLDLSLGVILLTCMGIGSNFLQVPAAKICARRTGPAGLLAGLALCASFVLLGTLPEHTPLLVLCFLMFLVGSGIALVHPQGLRGLQSLDGISPAVSTPIFMVGGFLGFSVSPFAGGLLVEYFGLKGLFWLLPVSVVLMAGTLAVRIQLAEDMPAEKKKQPCSAPVPVWSFRRMLWMAFFLNLGTVTISSLIPAILHERSFSLGFGGFSAMLFSLGSACGSLVIGALCRTRRPERLIFRGLFWGSSLGIRLRDVAPASSGGLDRGNGGSRARSATADHTPPGATRSDKNFGYVRQMCVALL